MNHLSKIFFHKNNKTENFKEKLDDINHKFQERKYDEVIELATLLIDSKDEAVSLEANKKIALSYFHKGCYKESLILFQKIALIKKDTENWFNVMTTALLAKEIVIGKDAFEKTLELQKAAGYNQQPSIPFIRYYYACALNDIGLFLEALDQLNELKKIYMNLVITDDTFVYIRGIPFMTNTLDLAVKVFKGLGEDFSKSDWLKELKQKVDDEGKNTIEEYYENKA
jgi:tetratricopeptide (TPR) repeat protein